MEDAVDFRHKPLANDIAGLYALKLLDKFCRPSIPSTDGSATWELSNRNLPLIEDVPFGQDRKTAFIFFSEIGSCFSAGLTAWNFLLISSHDTRNELP